MNVRTLKLGLVLAASAGVSVPTFAWVAGDVLSVLRWFG